MLLDVRKDGWARLQGWNLGGPAAEVNPIKTASADYVGLVMLLLGMADVS